ncbi:MAG: hypothetical protein K0R39_4475 [Symbiobacteriaceae bacterium]|jgi:hypothetical protein|nr:hypothetical protein [Symbiobacteriaceae bacterium]
MKKLLAVALCLVLLGGFMSVGTQSITRPIWPGMQDS